MAKRHEIDDKGNWNWDCNQKDRKFSIQVTGCPTEIEVSRWAVENKLIGLSDLSVATRNKFPNGEHVLTWSEFQEKALEKADRSIDPDTKAIAMAISTMDFSKLTPEQAEKARAALSALAGPAKTKTKTKTKK